MMPDLMLRHLEEELFEEEEEEWEEFEEEWEEEF